MTYLDSWVRDGIFVVPSLLRPDEVEWFLGIAEYLAKRYLDRDPVTGKRGFMVLSQSTSSIDNRDFYDACPDGWFEQVMDLIASPRLCDTAGSLMHDDPLFTNAAVFIDPFLPYDFDKFIQRFAARDGAGSWHRDVRTRKPDDIEKEELLADREGRNWVQVQIPLLPSNAFEFIPGSHCRWDTPAELAARKRGTTLAERTRPLPGGCRIELEPGDALFINPNGIHRGWYTHGIRRRTLAIAYCRSTGPLEHLESAPEWFFRPGYLDGLGAGTHAFFQRLVHACERVRTLAVSGGGG